MRKVSGKWVVPLVLVIAVLMIVGLKNSLAQQYFTFMGKVINIHRGNLAVQGDKGEVMNFAVGRRTIYVPARLPGMGERVKVSYYFQRGQNVGYQVEILPAPPPKK